MGVRRGGERLVEFAVFGPLFIEFARGIDHRRFLIHEVVDVVLFGFVFGADLLDRIAHQVERLAGHGGDCIADQADLATVLLQGDHGADAGHCLGFFEVERLEDAARDRGAQDHRLLQIREVDVVGILCPTGRLLHAVDAIDVGADGLVVGQCIPRRCIACFRVDLDLLESVLALWTERLVANGDLGGARHVAVGFVGSSHHLPPLAVLSIASMTRP